MGKLINILLSELRLHIFSEDDSFGDKQVLAIFPGRFQPMGIHHRAAFDWLVNKFGKENCYIVTSDKTNEKDSPFTFEEKRKIINAHGIDNVVKVKNPYNAVELIEKFDQKNTVVIYMVGEKDGDRLKPNKRLMKYNKTTAIPYKDIESPYAYFVTAPHISLNIYGVGEMSGTNIRKFLSENVPLEELKNRFHTVMGWFDDSIFNMIMGKLNPKFKTAKEIIIRRNLYKEGINNNIIAEGGLGGHMNHPFDDLNLSFGEFKEMIKICLSGEISVKNNVTEKLDGLNLFITFKDGKLFAARNKTDLKKGGMQYKDISAKFKGRGEIEKAFLEAFKDLETAIKGLSDRQKLMMFKDGSAWTNLEILYPGSRNIINYDGAYIVFHGTALYNKDQKLREYPQYARMLADMIERINAATQKTFSIKMPKELTIIKNKKFDDKLRYFVNKVDTLKNKMLCTDSDTIGNWHERFWEKHINKKCRQFNYAIPETVLRGIINRWVYEEKSFQLNNKNIQNDKFLQWVKSFEKVELKKMHKDNMLPFEYIILEFGSEVLKNVSDVAALNPKETVVKIKNDLLKAVTKLSKSKNIKDIEVLQRELLRLNSAGGIKAIVPLEGIVFNYNGKVYKLTGTFSPINQIISYFKFK
ncbi:cytidylyltransferase like protein [Microcystis phage Mel-JY01]